MSTINLSANVTDGVREVSEAEAVMLRLQGIIKDYARDNVIVHVGKPVGSISGWVGPLFWQVWTERGDPAGTVRARIDEDTAETWTFDPVLERPALLDAAKDRLIAEAQSLRAARLAEAQSEVAALG